MEITRPFLVVNPDDPVDEVDRHSEVVNKEFGRRRCLMIRSKYDARLCDLKNA